MFDPLPTGDGWEYYATTQLALGRAHTIVQARMQVLSLCAKVWSVQANCNPQLLSAKRPASGRWPRWCLSFLPAGPKQEFYPRDDESPRLPQMLHWVVERPKSGKSDGSSDWPLVAYSVEKLL